SAADNQGVGQAKLLQRREQRLGLGFRQRQIVNDDQAFRTDLGRQRVLQPECANLLGTVVLMAANDRPMGLAAAAELRGTSRMVTGATGTLLLVHLGAGTFDFRTPLGLVRTLLLLGKLPANHPLKDVLA